jgi:hypothetical protein
MYRVEAWTFPSDEEGGDTRLVDDVAFEVITEAQQWAWDRMEEGFQTRVWRAVMNNPTTPPPQAGAIPEPTPEGERLAQQYRAETSKEHTEGTREALERCVRMLNTYAPECFPANEQGQIHFARAMMEGVADEITKYLAAAERDRDDARRRVKALELITRHRINIEWTKEGCTAKPAGGGDYWQCRRIQGDTMEEVVFACVSEIEVHGSVPFGNKLPAAPGTGGTTGGEGT